MLNHYTSPEFEYEKLTEKEIFDILRISNENFSEFYEFQILTNQELYELTNRIIQLNPSGLFFKTGTVQEYKTGIRTFSDARLIFFKDNFKYSVFFSIKVLGDHFKDFGIEMISRYFYKIPFIWGMDYVFADESNNSVKNIKTGDIIVVDDEVLANDFFIESRIINPVPKLLRQVNTFFGLHLKVLELFEINDDYIIFASKNNIFLKVLDIACIDYNFLVKLIRRHGVKFKRVKQSVFAGGYLKL